METRQLGYFLIACQQPNHATAAKELGIAPSTLSTSLNLLEEELGIQLFRRTQQGFYPTKEARWLYSEAEVILRTMESAQGYLGGGSDAPLLEISIKSSLKFFLGRLSKVLSASIGQMQRTYPEVLFTVNFELGLEAALGRIVGKEPLEHPHHSILIDYMDPHQVMEGDCLSVCEDSWVVVSNSPIAGKQSTDDMVVTSEELRGLDLILPELPDRLRTDALTYCQRLGMPAPAAGEEDIGSLPRLSQTVEPFYFLVPRSALSSRLGQRRLFIYALQEPLISHLVARLETSHPAARDLVAEFARRVGDSDEGHRFQSVITLRQIAYFLEVFDTCNISLAAQRMRVAQPALSSQIRKLETTLGVPLFDRHRSGLAPTEAGGLFAVFAGLIREAQDRIFRNVVDISVQRQSRLRVGLIPLADDTTPLAGALARSVISWRESYPDVVIQVFEGPSDLLLDWIQSGVVHLAIVETTAGQGGRLELSKGDPLGVISNPAHGLIGEAPIDAEKLKGLKFVLPTSVFGIRRLIDTHLAGKTQLTVDMESNSLPATLELVRQSPVATILPRTAVERFVQSGELIFTPFKDPSLVRKLYVAFSNERELTAIERDFVSLLRQNLGISGALAGSDSGPEEADN